MQNTTRRLVLITTRVEPEWIERLRQVSPDLEIQVQTGKKVEEIADDLWQRVEILYTLNALPTPEQAPHLRWVQLYSAGADRFLDHPLFQSQVTFTTASGVHAVNIAEYVFMMQLAWFHHLPLILREQQKGQWPENSVRKTLFDTRELRDQTIGIVGYGSIGREVARLAKAFGMCVLAFQRSDDHHDHGFIFPGTGDPDGTLPDRYYKPEQLHTLLSESDVVVVAVPLTAHTSGLFDEAAFNAMKRSALLVNIARGEVCDEQALIRALQEKRIAGAALDVLDQEPFPSDHPLWQQPNVMLSPHIAGGSTRYDERAMMIFTESVRRYLAGQELYNVVDKSQGY